MMRINRWLLIFLLSSMMACAQLQPTLGEAVSSPSVPAVIGQNIAPEPEQKMLVRPLDAGLLFSLLGGEISGQRGDVKTAGAFYLQAARQSQDPQIALRAAQIALYSKDLLAAKEALNIALEMTRTVSIATRQMALVIYLRLGDVANSVAQINGLLLGVSESSKRGAMVAIGDAIMRNGSKDVAAAVIEVLLKGAPQDVDLYMLRSQYRLSLSDFNVALADAEMVVELKPAWEFAYMHLSVVLDKKGAHDRALGVLKNASEKFNSQNIMMAYAKLLVKQEKYLQARAQFMAVIRADNGLQQAKFSLALVHLKLNELDEAAAIFNGLYEAKFYPSKAAFYLGRISYFRKDAVKAMEWFVRVAKGESYVDAQSNISMIKYQAGDVKGAIEVIQRLRLSAPDQSARLYVVEADLLMSIDDYQGVYALMTEAMQQSDEDLSLLYTRAIAATELNDIAGAERDFLSVLEIEPNNVNALNGLGYLLASRTYRFKHAREYLNRAVSIRPNDAAILDSMGWLNYREGRYEDAYKLLSQAYKAVPEGEIAAHLGEVMWMLGRQHEAKALWERALKLAPADRYLLDVLDRLK